MLKILKGDDTGGTFGRQLDVTINAGEGVSLDGCHAEFVFDGIVKTIPAPLVSGEARHVHFSHNETAAMRLGTRYAALRVVDSAGKVRTFANTIAVAVTDRVNEVYPGESSLSVTVRQAVSWDEVSGKPKLVKTINGEAPGDDGNINIPAGGTVKSATVNGGEKVTPDAQGNLALTVEVGGKVQSVNGKTGEVALAGTDIPVAPNAVISVTDAIGSFSDLIESHVKNKDGNPHRVTAEQVGAYDKSTVDDKINQFAAHYLTADANGSAFATVAALTAEGAVYYYAGELHTPDKNDYAIVLNDGGKTARWAYFGETGEGEWQRQYYINETAFTDAEWAAIRSGITADLVPKVLTVDETTATKRIRLGTKVFESFAELTALVQKGVTRLRYYVTNASSRPVLYVAHLCDDSAIRFDATGTLGASVYTRSIAVTKNGEDGIAVSVGTLTEIAKASELAGKLDVTEENHVRDLIVNKYLTALGKDTAILSVATTGDKEEGESPKFISVAVSKDRVEVYGDPINVNTLINLINGNNLGIYKGEDTKSGGIEFVAERGGDGRSCIRVLVRNDDDTLSVYDLVLPERNGELVTADNNILELRGDAALLSILDKDGSGVSIGFAGVITWHGHSIGLPSRSGTFVVVDENGHLSPGVESRITGLAEAAVEDKITTEDASLVALIKKYGGTQIKEDEKGFYYEVEEA